MLSSLRQNRVSRMLPAMKPWSCIALSGLVDAGYVFLKTYRFPPRQYTSSPMAIEEAPGPRSGPVRLLPEHPLYPLHRRRDHLTYTCPRPQRHYLIVGRLALVGQDHPGSGHERHLACTRRRRGHVDRDVGRLLVHLAPTDWACRRAVSDQVADGARAGGGVLGLGIARNGGGELEARVGGIAQARALVVGRADDARVVGVGPS